MADTFERDTTERLGVVRTVLFADIADSSRILVAAGDERARRVFRSCLDAMVDVAESEQGEVVDEKGDEVMALFESPTRASAAAGAMQRAIGSISSENADLPRIALRIGFEHGSVLQSKEGVFGTTIYVSARLVSLAKAAQVLTTKETLEQVEPASRCDTRFFARQVLRGQPQEREIIELVWDPGNSTAWMPRAPAETGARVSCLELEYDGTLYRLDADTPRLELGRNPSSDVPVRHKAVSRLHARITWNNGSVQVEDVSTNGTLIEPESESSVPLHHEHLRLSGAGRIRLGTLKIVEDAPVLSYRCVGV